MKNKIFIVAVLVLMSGCFNTKFDSPESLLQHYVYMAFSGADDRDLEKLLTPNFLQTIREEQKKNSEGAREISFKNLTLKNYTMLNKVCEKPDICQIRFEVTYEEKNKDSGKIEFKTGTKKLAILKETSNKEWQIDEISHLKTQHEIKEELQIPSNP